MGCVKHIRALLDRRLKMREVVGVTDTRIDGIAVHCRYDKLAPCGEVKPHPRNPNRHPPQQIALFVDVLHRVGLRAPVIVSKRSGYIVKGHGTREALIACGCSKLPVVFQDFADDEEEVRFMIADNRLAELAFVDESDLRALLAELDGATSGTGFTDEDLVELAKADEEPEPETPDEVTPTLPGVSALKADIVFESKLAYEIPALRDDMLATPPSELSTWAGPDASDLDAAFYFYNWSTDSIRGLDLTRTVIGTYCEDYRFESFWNDPAGQTGKLLNMRPLCAVQTNFSIYTGYPLAARIWNRYRANWVARYWQEAGMRVIPDVITPANETEYGLFTLGIPANPPCIAMQIQTGVKDESTTAMIRRGIDLVLSGLKPGSLLLYHGDNVEELVEGVIPSTMPVIYVRNRMQLRREKVLRKGVRKDG